jgi:DNA (cytosine-5)-methyltransferase 1
MLRASFDLLPGELVVDNFAGGGGASTGIEAAIGRPVDIAINHSPEAIAMHRANHPETRHFCEDIWEVDPRAACGSRPVGLLWASPDCTHFSRAKGGQPRSQGIRGLAWVVVRWAEAVRPRVICVENVPEFKTWGPLGDDGRPDVARLGETFREWFGAMTALGYQGEVRSIVAADHGTPTTRERLFVIFRCDGRPIVWPAATHGKGRAESWRPASEIIDWTLPCPSIFERSKPLAEATQRRIAAGLRRFVLESGSPFIVPVTHQGGPGRVYSLADPLRTVTAANRGELSLVAPTLIQTGYGERKGQAPRALDLGKPLGTVVAGGGRHALCAAFLAKHYGGVTGHGVQQTLGTVTTVDHHSLVTASFVSKFYGTSTGVSVSEPLPTVTTGGGRGGGHLAEVRAFLLAYYGAGGRDDSAQQLGLPLHTVTTRARFGLVMIHGQAYEIADIGMRMLSPRELFRAQGFPDTYEIAPLFAGKPLSKTAQIEKAGNSVCPPVARALVAANASSFMERAAS